MSDPFLILHISEKKITSSDSVVTAHYRRKFRWGNSQCEYLSRNISKLFSLLNTF